MEENEMAKRKDDERIVKVLAFEKKIVPSDGFLYGTIWERRKIESKPLAIREKSVRGTISNSLKDSILKDPMKLSAEIEKANLQTVDCCFLDENDDTLVLKFTVKFLGNIENPSACSNSIFLNKYQERIYAYKNEYKFSELSFRYAYNIASARYLWRNRLGAEKIEVIVTDCKTGKKWEYNSKEFSLRDFDRTKNTVVDEFANRIAETFMGKDASLFEIMCFAKIGNSQEVYPSEEMVLDKSKNDKSKILYSVNSCAAFHSQKIGNAIRTIDTWYPEFGEKEGVGPIAIDSYGPVTTISKAFRSEKKTDFYSICDTYVWDDALERDEDKHFFMAMIIRGGVFGTSSENKDKE